ncbi:hypothetical protein B0H17DRAFT_1201574 [Mycena rosella]|uniref:Ribonuclease H1 N-terminal domain-containing protein n=1 Tax=Mycena rosella TaxID=1033263 RepID=A0AAD7DGD0_MYCRO|nr:hypothetical protein B0H17DRAFT_1201574 [Mycena rosella]
MAPLTPLAIAQLLSPHNPNPLPPEVLERLTIHLSFAELQTVVQLLSLGDLARVTAPLIPRLISAAQDSMRHTSPDNDDEVDCTLPNLDLASLHLNDEDPGSPPPLSPELPTTPAKACNRSAPSTPPHPRAAPPVYHFTSPARSGSTPDWPAFSSISLSHFTDNAFRLDAGSATQGVPGSSVRATAKTPKAHKPPAAAYVVFIGHEIGVFTQWPQVQKLTHGYRSAFQAGFPSVAVAEKALAYTRAQGWTSDSSVPKPPLPLPSSYEPNALNSPSSAGPLQWYVVSRGVHPGIYSSGLECHLNVATVKSSLYKCYTSCAAAEAAFTEQFVQGQLRTISV